MATTGDTWEHDFGPLVHQYWAIVEHLYLVQKAKGVSNAAFQTIATAVMGKRNAGAPTSALNANSIHISLAQGLSANNFS